MRILVAPDSFKESLSAGRVAKAIAAGLLAGWPEVETVLRPLADGGEGTLAALTGAGFGRLRSAYVQGSDGRRQRARILLNGSIAVVEAAEAVGAAAVPEPRSPWTASGLGVGQMVETARRWGATDVQLALGGTVTIDGGLGLLRAFGVMVLDRRGREVPPTLGGLEQASRIEVTRPLPAGTALTALTDVSAPLLGPRGSVRLYGPQKGLQPDELDRAEHILGRWHLLLSQHAGRSLAEIPGSGAAGGLGAAVLFLGGRLVPGIDRIMELTAFRTAVADSELVLTGEGRLDRQTLQGKVVDGVVRVCREGSRPAIALVGGLAEGYRPLYRRGLLAAFTIGDGIVGWPASRGRTAADLRRTAENLARLLRRGVFR